MIKLTGKEIRQKYLDFFKSKEHSIIPSASLIPENDPTVLFTTAGMHPLVPFLLGEKHPAGNRLANAQKCIRTQDIDEVGDNRHLTFFEMMGNWSLGNYFKKEAIEWSFEFLTDVIKIDPSKLYVSVFEGDKDAPRDEESIKVWKETFKKKGIDAEVGDRNKGIIGNSRIFIYPKSKNWWGPAGETGPCGPCTEMFIDLGTKHNEKFGKVCHPNCDCGRFIEIWNDVFMQFNKIDPINFVPLSQKKCRHRYGS
jgi:alanyl-tRNA synthetase